MKKLFDLLAHVFGGLVISVCTGCIEIDPLIQGAPSREQYPCMSCCYWGSAYKDRPYSYWADGGDQDHTLFSVRPKYNYWYAWITVLSFGALMPLDLEWRYNKD